MKKQVKKQAKKQKQIGNKGFSLVELIIVIAIMAILVGVLAPSLIRYVEKTNVSADTQLADAVKTAVMTAMMDPTVLNSTDSSSLKFTAAHSSAVSINTDCEGEFKNSIIATLGISGSDIKQELVDKLKSAHDSAADILVKTDGNNSVEVTITTTDNTGGKNTSDSSKYIVVK